MARIYDNTKSPILNNPYEEPRLFYDTDMGTEEHQYMPDFIARVRTPQGEDVNLMIEISGFSDDRTGHKDAKRHYTLDYWLPAANNLGQYGRWDFVEVSDIDNIKRTLIHKIQEL
jgi:type III restriction enzyme